MMHGKSELPWWRCVVGKSYSGKHIQPPMNGWTQAIAPQGTDPPEPAATEALGSRDDRRRPETEEQLVPNGQSVCEN